MTRPLRVVASGQDEADDFTREPPHDLAAEQYVLGSVMLSPAALAEVRRILDGSEFYRPAHQTIWATIAGLADHGEPHEPTAVRAALGANLSKTGGAVYLFNLIETVAATASAPYYAHIVRDLAYARRVTETGARLIQLAHSLGEETSDLRAAVTAETKDLTTPDAHGWPEPTPLTAVAQLPPFPIATLPDWLGEYVASLAEVTQTPLDLAGCLALAVLAVAAAGKVWVAASRWREPTNLFIVVVAEPGTRKTEVYRAMTAPIQAAENALREAAKARIDAAVIARRVAETNAERTAKAAEDAADQMDPIRKKSALIDAAEARRELEEAIIPAAPVLFTDDVTPEKLGSRLVEQGGRFAILSDEGDIFAIAAGRYSGTPNFGVLKKAHAGTGLRVDRKNSQSERIDTATLTLGICTQPGVIARLSDTPEFREQGLLGRFLYAVPESLLGRRNPTPDPITSSCEAAYHTSVKALILSLAELTEPATLHFTPGGNDAITRMLADIEPRFLPGQGDLAHMTDWGGKLVGATVRVAALLHLAEHLRDGWNTPINAATFDQARTIADYFITHAQAAYDQIGADPATSNARAILDWATNTATIRFTTRDVMRGLKHRFSKVADVEPALRILDTHGWIRRLPDPPRTGTGRTRAASYEIHPDALGDPR